MYFKRPQKKDNKDYYFLLGFYHRCFRNLERSEEYYQEVLSIDDGHSRTKRELVILYMIKGQYDRALGLAKDNYKRFPRNIYHCQAYFTCLIKKQNLSPEEVDEISDIFEIVQESLSEKAKEIFDIMRGEYEYYVNNNLPKAIQILTDSLKINDKKHFAFRSLYEIYVKSNMKAAAQKLQAQYDYLVGADSEL